MGDLVVGELWSHRLRLGSALGWTFPMHRTGDDERRVCGSRRRLTVGFRG